MKPDVVLFGEAMPARFRALAFEDFRAADLLLIFGTSFQVTAAIGHLASVCRFGEVSNVFVAY